MTEAIIDTYHGNPATAVAAALAASDGVIAKATEGARYVDTARKWSNDSSHDSTVALARATGKLVGHYHFGWLGLDAAQQAAHFLDAAGALPGDVLALDCERYPDPVPAGQWLPSPAERLTWVLAFTDFVRAKTGAPCWLYANRSELAALRTAAVASGRLAAFESIPKWPADPDHAAGHPSIEGTWVCHQYATTGHIDRDLFAGDATAWHALGVPGLVAPGRVPPPPPAPYPGKPLGWKSTGAPVSTLQRSFRQPATGHWTSELSAAVNAWYARHTWARSFDRCGSGGVGRWGYAGIVRDYPKG